MIGVCFFYSQENTSIQNNLEIYFKIDLLQDRSKYSEGYNYKLLTFQHWFLIQFKSQNISKTLKNWMIFEYKRSIFYATYNF